MVKGLIITILALFIVALVLSGWFIILICIGIVAIFALLDSA